MKPRLIYSVVLFILILSSPLYAASAALKTNSVKSVTLDLADVPFDTPQPKTGHAMPDLMVQNIVFAEKELISNVDLDAKVLIKNVGRAAVTTKVPYAFGDSPKDVKFLSKSPIAIRPGQTVELPFTWQFPVEQPSLQLQEKPIHIILDPLNEIQEDGENNGFYKIFDVYSIIQGSKQQTKYYPGLKDKNEYFIASKKEFCLDLNKNSICNKREGNEYRIRIEEKPKAGTNRILSLFKRITTNAILFNRNPSGTKNANAEAKDNGIKLTFKSVVEYTPLYSGISCAYADTEEMLASCPTAMDLYQIRSDFNIYYDGPPEPWSCTQNGDEHSATLNLYNALRFMKCVPLNGNLPWSPEHNNLYNWLKDVDLEGVELFATPSTCTDDSDSNECYNYYSDGVIHLIREGRASQTFATPESRRVEGVTYKATLIVHEAQHKFLLHNCGRGNDLNPGEMGAWAVHYFAFVILAENTDNFFKYWQRSRFQSEAEYRYTHRFCDIPYSISLGQYGDSCIPAIDRCSESALCEGGCSGNTTCEVWSAGNYRCSCLHDGACEHGMVCTSGRCKIPNGGECDTRRADLCISGRCAARSGERFKGYCE